MAKSKTCLGCNKLFAARKDAKTCSSRCRKRLERNRRLFALEINAKPAFKPIWKLGFGSAQHSQHRYQPTRLVKSRLRKKLPGGKWKNIAAIIFFVLVGLHASHALALAEGYTTYDSGLKQGMVVELSPQSSQGLKVVDRATINNPARVLGVSVSLDDSLITTASASSKVYVASSGEAKAYVSDIDGVIKKGDLLSISPLDGVLMKNSLASQGIVGTALADFPASYQTVTAHNASGKQISSKVGLLPVNVDLVLPGADASGQTFLGQLGQSITGRNIGTQRVAAAAVIFSVLLVIEGSLVYSTISNSLVAIGRNPLASRMVRSQAYHSLSVAAVILLIGGSIISIILWL